MQRVVGILTGEVVRTMQLMGATSVADLTPDVVLPAGSPQIARWL